MAEIWEKLCWFDVGIFRLSHGHIAGMLVSHLHLREAVSRVEDCKAEGGNQDHDIFEHDEFSLVLHDRIAPAASHLGNTIDTSSKDGNPGYDQGHDKELEFGTWQERDGRLAEAIAVCIGGSCIEASEGSEDKKSEDLEDDTGHHEVVAHFLHFVVIGSGGDSSTGTLKDQGEEITEDEDPSVPSCL